MSERISFVTLLYLFSLLVMLYHVCRMVGKDLPSAFFLTVVSLIIGVFMYVFIN